MLVFHLLIECAAAQKVFISKSSEVSFYSVAPIENIDAHNSSMSSILNTYTNELAFIVPIRNFRFKKALMQEHFNEKYLESDKFPQATFQGKILGTVPYTQDGSYPVAVEGKLTIHGITRDIHENGTIHVSGNEIKAESEFRVAVANYKISIPQLLFENIADTVTVKLNVVYKPYEK